MEIIKTQAGEDLEKHEKSLSLVKQDICVCVMTLTSSPFL